MEVHIEALKIEVPIEAIKTNPVITPSPITVFHEHLRQTEPVFAELMDLKEKGWKNAKGDEFFQQQRHRADTATRQAAARFYRMMKEIGDEMQATTSAFSLPNSEEPIQILDLCMAPGGYTSTALKYNPSAHATGITLPPSHGGHEVFLHSPRSVVHYHDITMFAAEFSTRDIPLSHPAPHSFSLERPLLNQRFSLIICDGQVLRTHARAEYRARTVESIRLRSAQLILALQRIRPGGSMIILLHHIEALDSLRLLYLFSRFATIEVFKPVRKHAIRSTFYLIARGVQPGTEAAREAVGRWKGEWWRGTFGGVEGAGRVEDGDGDGDDGREVIEGFGERFVEIARPVWKVQMEALRKMDFVR